MEISQRRFFLILLLMVLGTSLIYAFSNYFYVDNSGTITTIGVEYWDSGQQGTVTAINWVTDVNDGHNLEPGASYTFYGYLYNPSSSSENITCSITTDTYTGNTTETWDLTWNYAGDSIAPGVYVACDFTLSILGTATEGESFGFRIVIEGIHDQ